MEEARAAPDIQLLAYALPSVLAGIDDLFHSFEAALVQKALEAQVVPFSIEHMLASLTSHIGVALLRPDPRHDDLLPHDADEPIASPIDHYTPQVLKREYRTHIEVAGATTSGEGSFLGTKYGRFRVLHSSTI